MTTTRFDWERYQQWNDAIAEVVYPTARAGLPVYLDLEDEVLDAIRDKAEPMASDSTAALVAAVRGVLRIEDGPAVLLRAVLQRLDRWEQGSMMDPPPTLAFLALLCLAAENMHRGDGQAANNFYGRLAQLLALDERRTKWFIDAYRRTQNGQAVSDHLWSSVNFWLEFLEGNRGLATVYASKHAHVSLPLSQALVRQVDRDKFTDLFASYGLTPHSSLPAIEMEELISEWLSRVPCPASQNLGRIWKRDAAARERIVDVARITLESWDGWGAEGSAIAFAGHRQVDSVRTKVLLRTFPVRQLEVSLIIAARSDAEIETFSVVGPDDACVGTLDMVPSASGWLSLADPSEIDTGSFLGGLTRLRRQDEVATLRRRPRRVVPMLRDDLLQAFVEAERINLGEDAILLVHKDVADRVEGVLEASARPGFARHDVMIGLPEGWILFDAVQVLSSISADLVKHLDLNGLQPLATSQVILQGGLKLPGNIPKWSSFRPPELRTTVGEGISLVARLVSTRALTNPTPKPIVRSTPDPVLIWNLSDEHLPDGDYEIAVAVDGEAMGRPQVLRLRSADNPAVVIETAQNPLVHDPDDPAFAIYAVRSRSATTFRLAPAGGAIKDERLPNSTPGWWSARIRTTKPPAEAGRVVVFPGAAEGSCMLTGAHLMRVESVVPGHSSTSTVEGVCAYCGRVRRYPTRGRKKREGRSEAVEAPRIIAGELTRVADHPPIDWHVGFDALCHMGSGSISALERVALQIEPSGLFSDTFARRLEVLGHIEIERDPRNLMTTRWEVIEPTLVGRSDGRTLLLGFRSEHMLAAVEDAAYAAGIELTTGGHADAPARIRMESDDPAAIAALATVIEAATGKAVRHIPNAAEALAGRLPPLSKALLALPTTATVSARTIERWDPVTARFAGATDTSRPGAYRLKGFSRSYIYRRLEDLGAMRGVVGDARIVKFAAALDTGEALIGYDEPAKVLYVPLGAELPGLYGRAAVLSSGLPPQESTDQRLLEYRNVPASLAAHLCGLLMS